MSFILSIPIKSIVLTIIKSSVIKLDAVMLSVMAPHIILIKGAQHNLIQQYNTQHNKILHNNT